MNGELPFLTLWETANLLRQKQISARELVEAYLQRIETYNPGLNAFLTITADRALHLARQADQEIAAGKQRGHLHGMPLALKDLFDTAGVRTTAGAKFYRERVPAENAFVVQKLENAGVVLLGKLNMHEIALGVTNVNPHYGACRNPWNTRLVTGGSSGGSGAALAAGLCLGSLGSDTGGSIRIPASLCGVVGFKPTRGRLSLRGVLPLSWNVDHVGPMARSVRDIVLLMQAIDGYDSQDPYSLPHEAEDWLANLEAGVRGWRVAVADDEFYTSATHPEVLAGVNAAAVVFEQLGALVTRVPFPGARQAAAANLLVVTSDAAAYHQERLQTSPEDFGEDVLRRLQAGAAYTSSEYIRARHAQATLRRQFELFFESYDALLTPATPVPAPPIEGPDAVEQARLLTRFTAPFNLTGLPSISMPCGFTSGNLPFGLQITAAPWADRKVLQAAQAYEQATAWHTRHPEGYK